MKNTKNNSMSRKDALATLPPERIEHCIYLIRGQRVMLDADLAAFYGVSIKRLNEQVKRNLVRFPSDFMFQLSAEEADALRSQTATLDVIGPEPPGAQDGSRRGKHRKYRPYAFTEHGALMAASVLHSQRAIEMSLLVVRAFVRLRAILADHRKLARRIEALEREFVHKTAEHEQHIQRIYQILEDLMHPPAPPKKGRIGFVG